MTMRLTPCLSVSLTSINANSRPINHPLIIAKPRCTASQTTNTADNVELPDWISKTSAGKLQFVHSVELNTQLELQCLVESDMPVDHYQWTHFDWQSDGKHYQEVESDNKLIVDTGDSRSTTTTNVTQTNKLNYLVQEYGLVNCRAKNSIGLQQEPCQILIRPVGVPKMLQMCQMMVKFFDLGQHQSQQPKPEEANSWQQLSLDERDIKQTMLLSNTGQSRPSNDLNRFVSINANNLNLVFECQPIDGPKQSKSLIYHLDVYYSDNQYLANGTTLINGDESQLDSSTGRAFESLNRLKLRDNNLVRLLQLNTTLAPKFTLNMSNLQSVWRNLLVASKENNDADTTKTVGTNGLAVEQIESFLLRLRFWLYASNLLGPGSANRQLDGASLVSKLYENDYQLPTTTINTASNVTLLRNQLPLSLWSTAATTTNHNGNYSASFIGSPESSRHYNSNSVGTSSHEKSKWWFMVLMLSSAICLSISLCLLAVGLMRFRRFRAMRAKTSSNNTTTTDSTCSQTSTLSACSSSNITGAGSTTSGPKSSSNCSAMGKFTLLQSTQLAYYLIS